MPPEFASLTNVTSLLLADNKLTTLPPEIASLTNLTVLDLHSNQLTVLPPEIASLTNLTELDLLGNQLTALPPELGHLTKLENLSIGDNPLPDALRSVAERSTEELLAYLRSLQEAQPLYEAKVVFVGEGEVGKTSLLAAIRGEKFVERRPTTHGIEIHTFELPHPDLDEAITLNAWDFGGQPVYRVTHQFFFSKRSLYLLLWNSRLAVGQGDVEGWIRRIRLRVGDGARIIIVATRCESEGRIARIDEAQLRKDHGDVIAGFQEVDSKTSSGVEELKTLIASVAAGLPQMGEPFNTNWQAARDEVLAIDEPRIPFSTFAEVCASHGLDQTDTGTLIGLMHDLGHIVYYGGDEGLADDVVLRPDWLTKAIGYVLEDRETNNESGVLAHSRLSEVWHDSVPDGEPQYETALHPFFLRVMEKYDVSYRIEGEQSSLVTQLVPNVRPDLPWAAEDIPGGGQAQIALTCEMDEAPPGLVPWMTVRTHHFATEPRRHWQRGMFLQYGDHGEALLELSGRELRIAVRATWPDYLMNILHFTLERLIDERWAGLHPTYSVPCPTIRDSGDRCSGRFPLEYLRASKSRSRDSVECHECYEGQEVDRLLIGFAPALVASGEVDLDQRLERIELGVAGIGSQIAAGFSAMMRALGEENRESPRVFTIQPQDRRRFDPRRATSQRYRLTLWCEYPDEQHPTCAIGSGGDGEYTFERPREWLVTIGPYASLIAKTLATVAPIAAPAVKAVLNEDLLKDVGKHIDWMEKMATGLPKDALDIRRGPNRPEGDTGGLTEAEGAGVRQLHTLLLELDPAKTWGNLRRALPPTGEYLWLCPTHYHKYDPGLPVLD